MTDRSTDGATTVADRTGERADDTSAVPMKARIQATLAKVRTELANSDGGGEPVPSSGSARRARLRLTRIDPWSVMKMAFLLSIALGVVTIVAVSVVWIVLGAAGVWDSVNSAVVEIVGEEAGAWSIQDYLGTARVLGFTMIVSVINVVLITAISTLGAFLYNMAAALLGGIEMTFTEDR